MIRKTITIIALLLFIGSGIIIVAGQESWFQNFLSSEEPLEVKFLELSSDKENYQSNETMTLTMELESSKYAENIQIHIWGLENPRGKKWINEKRSENLKEGVAEFKSIFKMPSCTPCEGYEEGTYNIYAMIFTDNHFLDNTSTSVHLAQ